MSSVYFDEALGFGSYACDGAAVVLGLPDWFLTADLRYLCGFGVVYLNGAPIDVRCVKVENGMLAIFRVLILNECESRWRLRRLLLGQVDRFDLSKGQEALLNEFVSDAVGWQTSSVDRRFLIHYFQN